MKLVKGRLQWSGGPNYFVVPSLFCVCKRLDNVEKSFLGFKIYIGFHKNTHLKGSQALEDFYKKLTYQFVMKLGLISYLNNYIVATIEYTVNARVYHA